MFNNFKLWTKIMVTMGLSVILVTLALTASNLHTMNALVSESEKRELTDHVKAVAQGIAAESRMAEALAAFVAALPPVQESFAAGNREALTALLLPAFQTMAPRFGIEQFQFHTLPATSFLRLHKPEKFGDDLSSFRRTVVDANQTRKSVRGLESGVSGLGIRGVVPMERPGRPLAPPSPPSGSVVPPSGSVEFGIAFNQGFFDAFKERQRVDLALHLVSGDKIVTFGSTLGKTPLSEPAVILKAAAGEAQLSHLEIDGRPLAVYVSQLRDYAGTTLGVLEVAMDRRYYVQTLADARNSSALVGIAVLLAGMVLALLTARQLSRRIFIVKRGVEHMAGGDLTAEIPEDGTDELGELARAADRMRAQLHDLALEVYRNAGRIHAAAQEITGSVDGQAATSSQMSASVAEITSTMEELSASSVQIAEHSSSLVDIATLTYENIKKGSEAMQVVMSKMNDIHHDNQGSLSEILDLGRRSKEISKVMEIINSVADQTKLIAFNAALEAASAGDSGRRFGVVAAEIRRLADSVTDSTGEIEARINQIQDSISRLVVTSEKGAKGIGHGIEAAAHTAGGLNELVGAARQTTNAAQQISLSTQQQRTASSQVVVALREIVAASSHTTQSITRIAEISRDMARLSATLETLVNRFRLRDTVHPK